jgi:hypothetical protein
LLLMVAHLDAVVTLHNYVSGTCFIYKGVSIKVVAPPPVTKKLLSWDKLLGYEHFPQPAVDSASGEPSNEDIITFLHKALLMRSTMKHFCQLVDDKNCKKNDVDAIIKTLQDKGRKDGDITGVVERAWPLIKQIHEPLFPNFDQGGVIKRTFKFRGWSTRSLTCWSP